MEPHYIAVCDRCRKQSSFNAKEPEEVRVVLRKEGWRFGTQPTTAYCPECVEQLKTERPWENFS